MKRIIFQLALILNILAYNNGNAQTDVWPVQVSGSMLPPHSLNLKVYGTDRTEDLSFNVMLRDPIQPSLWVKPVITIEQNGSVVYQTDPNFAGKPILLSQFESMIVNGSLLGEYLSNVAMIGTTPSSDGSIKVPEGFNQICLQMYGVDRYVPVSNKFCISGNFRLNLPPRIVKPAFNETIKKLPVQNLVFSWQPMHIGSPNNPGPVEYTFDLVELPTGVMNANDAFPASLKVYSTKTMATSIIYAQGEPVLEEGKYYAWRVTATSVLYPSSTLFQNDGKSEVSVFMLYNKEAPLTDFNSDDKPSPRGCSVFQTSYGSVTKADNEPAIVSANQNVKLGYFNMKVTEATGSQSQGYSGKGLVEYPMLRSYLEVAFKNIKVNQDGRVYESGIIEALIDPALHLMPEQLSPALIASNLTSAYIDNLSDAIDDAHRVSMIQEGNYKKNSLPIAIENDSFPQNMVIVTGVRFTTDNAYLTLIGLGKSEIPAVSAATAIAATPYGIKNGAYLVPVSNTTSESSEYLTSTIMQSVSSGNNSKIYCDCNGVTNQKLNTTVDLFVNPDILSQKGLGTPLKLTLKDKNQTIKSYNGDIGPLNEFVINGLNDYTFRSEGGSLNLDETKRLDGVPESGEGTSTKKLWIKEVSTTLPAVYNPVADVPLDLKGSLVVGEEFIENGSFKKENILPLSKGIIEKWKYSVDEISLQYRNQQMQDPELKGKIKLPVSSQAFGYTGKYNNIGNQAPVLHIDKLPEQLPVEMWHGTMDLKPQSSLNLAVKSVNGEKTFYPDASLTGDFALKLDNNDFNNAVLGNVGQTLEDIKKVFNLTTDDVDFAVSGIAIENWLFDPYTTKDKKYKASNVDVSNAKFMIGGKSYPITGSEIVYSNDKKERLGLSFTTVAGNNRISFTIWGEDKDGTFIFEGIEENSYQLKCDCDSGKSIGYQDYNKIYDEIIRKNFLPRPGVRSHSGGVAAQTDDLNSADAALYQTKLHYLQENTYDGFILKDPTTLYWPLLKKDLKVSSNAEGIWIQESIVLTKDDLKNLGFKSEVWLPTNYNLEIGALLIDFSKENGKKVQMVIGLMPIKNMPADIPATFVFASELLPVKGNEIKIADVKLGLRNLEAVEGYEVMWKPVTGDQAVAEESYANLDCTKGLSNIVLYGNLLVSKVLDEHAEKSVQKDGSLLEIPIRASIENVKGRSFENYIAVCSDYIPGNKDIKWNFTIPDQPHIVFQAGNNYEIYYDHHSGKDVSAFDAAKSGLSKDNKSYQGLVFKKFTASINGFEGSAGKALEVNLKNGAFVSGKSDKNGFFLTYSATSVVKEDAGASFSGWKYSIDTLSFSIEDSRMEKDLNVIGYLQIPIFKSKPVDFENRHFDRGWLPYRGEIIALYGIVSSTLGFTFMKDKLYQSVLMPGMGMQLASSSVVFLKYDDKTGKLIPYGQFAGLCDFYLNKNVSASLNVISVPGLEIEADPIAFENLIVSAESFSSALKFKVDEGQTSYLHLGNWGDVDSRALADLPDVQYFKDRISMSQSMLGDKVSGTSPAGSTTKPAAGGTTKPAAGNTATAGKGTKSPLKKQFLGFDFVQTYLGPTQRDGEIVMGLRLAVALLGSTREKGTKQQDAKAQTIKADGVLGLVYRPGKTSQDTWEFSEFTLECLEVAGGIGPLSFSGGLNILRGDANYGSGLKGYLTGELEELGGLTIVGQFGKQKEADKEYYYGFLDLEAYTEQGIPLFYDPITNVPKMDLFGAGGGIRINMMTENAMSKLEMPATSEEKAKKEQEAKDAEARKASKNFCIGVGNPLLQPGKGLTQSYKPNKGTYGGNFFLIFGPYSPVKPPYPLVADAGLQMDIDWNDETNELSIGEIILSGRAYLMPASIGKRREENMGDMYAGVTLDWRNKFLSAEIAFRTKFDVQVIGTTLFSFPEDYSKTDFTTRAFYNQGYLKFGFNPSDPYVELKLGGPGTGRLSPLSARFMVSPVPLSYATVNAYAQLGANVDAPRALEDMIPELKPLLTAENKKEREEYLKADRGQKVDVSVPQSKGIAFGLTLKKDLNANFLLMHASLMVKLGFDINLREYKDITCSNSSGDGQIGLNGWYAKGSAFAYARGRIDMGFRFLGTDLTTPVFDASAYVAMQAEGPNPSYFRGFIGGKYDVLGGVYSGEFNYKLIIGEQCELAKEPDPVADIKIFSKASIRDKQKDVDRYNDISLKTNAPLRKDYTLTQRDKNNEASHAVNFMADYERIEVFEIGPVGSSKARAYEKNGNPGIPMSSSKYNLTVKPDGKSVDISFKDALEPETMYAIEYVFIWKIKKGSEAGARYETYDKKERGTLTFTTGKRPSTITAGMIEYSAPGDGQRYWHKGYADTEIKFKLKALDDAKALFPEICESCGLMPGTQEPIRYKYVAQVWEIIDQRKRNEAFYFNITGYPGKGENAKIVTPASKSIDGKYDITYLEERSVPVSKVSFPDIKNFAFKKSEVYELEIVRKLDIKLPPESDKNYDKLNKMREENYLKLKSYYFGISEYESLQDKLADLEVQHVKSKVKLRDFSHPSDVYDSERASVISELGESKFHSVKDDYYTFKIKNRKNNESFDYYDIMRLRRNILLGYNQDYMPAMWVSYIHQYKGMNDVISGLLRQKEFKGSNYLYKVLYDYTRAEKDKMLSFGSADKISDGTSWHYRIEGTTDPEMLKLTDWETWCGSLRSKPKEWLSSGVPELIQGGSADFVLQDLRSRIVINQLHWLSRIRSKIDVGEYSGKKEYDQIGTKGEFKNGAAADFSWIETPPPGKTVSNEAKNSAYVASEPGYRLSYHDYTLLFFPASKDWGAMTESKREKESGLRIAMFRPNREPSIEIPMNNPTELSLDEWYRISRVDNGQIIHAKHNSGLLYYWWGLEQPYFDKNEASAYGIYTSAHGLIYDDGWNFMEEIPSDYSDLWRFSNEGDAFKIRNYVYKYRDVKFPAVLETLGNDIEPRFRGNKEDEIKVKFTEVNSRFFSPEKKYRIRHVSGGRVLTDYAGCKEWKIVRDGRFYRIISTSNNTLYGHKEENTFSSDEWTAKTEKSNFPSRGTSNRDRNHYLRRVWNILPNGGDTYIIQNGMYINHYLYLDGDGKNNMDLTGKQPEDGRGRFIIEEIR
ncbi:MAG TPA: hypothetical protein PLQ53_10825 [Saprospiraceae bacterium]|nr:hypothetical protein [Saprospiraceae bacterium]